MGRDTGYTVGSAGMRRRVPLRRSRAKRTRARPRPTPQAVDRGEALARFGGMCARCGRERATNVHHRIGRGMGGSRDPRVHSLAALVGLCGQGNTTGCHAWAEADRGGEATILGYRISRHGRRHPADVPLFVAGLGPVLFADDGSWSLAGDSV